MTVQYQSFPGAAGDSHTLDKLKALMLPDLAGRSFLDVGCNEGFFCGFARHLGADRVVGIDHSARFVQRARQRFPDCKFLRQGWEKLPKEKFDVILLASAIHYAEDQPALIARLVDKLTPGGVLVVELGIVPSTESEWVKVERGIDERYFPTMEKLREVLAGYAWKWMGPSVTQAGDPVKRHVLHISRRLPVAYLMLQPPGYGKSTVARGLFPAAGVTLVSGDQLLGQVARGRRKAPGVLKRAVAQDYSPFNLDQTLARLFEQGLGRKLVGLWISEAGAGDFALDGYVPEAFHAEVEQALTEAGYLPVKLAWNRVGPPLIPRDRLSEQAEAFYLSLTPEAGDAPPREATGFVDEIHLARGVLQLRGWAVAATGRMPARLAVTLGGREHPLASFERQLRPDVQSHLNLPHGLFGFVATIDVSAAPADPAWLGSLAVTGQDAGGAVTPFQFSGPAARWIARHSPA